MEQEQNYWRKCGACKCEIQFGQAYQKCSVSSCRKWVFCSVDCWDIHQGVLNHKSAWAEENTAPNKEQAMSQGTRRIVVTPKANKVVSSGDVPRDILIVASKLKNYVKSKHDLNTSQNVMEALSDIVRDLVDEAVDRARGEGRKTLMDRDFP